MTSTVSSGPTGSLNQNIAGCARALPIEANRNVAKRTPHFQFMSATALEISRVANQGSIAMPGEARQFGDGCRACRSRWAMAGPAPDLGADQEAIPEALQAMVDQAALPSRNPSWKTSGRGNSRRAELKRHPVVDLSLTQRLTAA